MSTTINNKNNTIIIIPPNSEAILEAQRFGTKTRTVGGYYVSNKSNEVTRFLNFFHGNYLIDVAFSYKNCLSFFEEMIANCSGFYKDGLDSLTKALDLIGYTLKRNEEDLLFVEASEFRLTESKKYLKISGSSVFARKFKQMILGDVIEIVIKKVSDYLYVIYLRPRDTVVNFVSNRANFGRWLSENTKQ